MGFFPFLIVYAFPLITVWGANWGPMGFYACVVAAFVVVPILDLLVGNNLKSPEDSQQKALSQALQYKLVLWVFVPVQILLLLWAARLFCQPSSGLWERVGLILSVGTVTGGIGITFAHELGHRNGVFERSLSRILLMTVCYGHWHIEHVVGHHAHVATPRDPATARANQSLYAFLWQTVPGTFKGSWALERERGQRRHKGLSLRISQILMLNRMVYILLGQLLIALFFAIVFQPLALCFFFGQSFVAILLLEIINYIEHYGLTRRLLPDGRYEKVTAAHSWNCTTRISNWLLINLQRHSDHHMHPSLRYPQLHHMPGSPQLPTGYAGMVIIALLPPLFRALVHPRMESCQRFGH